MPDYRSMSDKEYLASWDLEEGKDYELVIDRVEARDVYDMKTKKEAKRCVVYFEGRKKGMVMSGERGEAVAAIANSTMVEDWIGLKIVVYVGHGNHFGVSKMPKLAVKPV